MEPNTVQSRRERYLTFFLGEEQYGIAIDRIKEIIAMMKVTYVPKTPPYMKGVINLRGSIIPIIDTRLRFGMELQEADMHTAIIYCRSGESEYRVYCRSCRRSRFH